MYLSDFTIQQFINIVIYHPDNLKLQNLNHEYDFISVFTYFDKSDWDINDIFLIHLVMSYILFIDILNIKMLIEKLLLSAVKLS